MNEGEVKEERSPGDMDPDFGPQSRTRCNTWPLRPLDIGGDTDGAATPPSATDGVSAVPSTEHQRELFPTSGKKSSSRRNAWGNLSYADLITRAIQSSPEQRLTLSQIYDWMVQNIAYFKDKGDSNSSAGWKNSIRHNLSLHNRFVRIQNDGAGKSSWWMLNPEAKPGKTPRRKTIDDMKSFEKARRGARKKVEARRREGSSLASSAATSTEFGSQELGTSSGGGGFDHFTLNPPELRVRTGSNASSLGSRLSPISAVPDAAEESCIFENSMDGMTSRYDPGADHLATSLADLMVDGGLNFMNDHISPRDAHLSPQPPPPPPAHMSPQLQTPQTSGLTYVNMHSPPPPPYPAVAQRPPMVSAPQFSGTTPAYGGYMSADTALYGDIPQQEERRWPPQSLSELLSAPEPLQHSTRTDPSVLGVNSSLLRQALITGFNRPEQQPGLYTNHQQFRPQQHQPPCQQQQLQHAHQLQQQQHLHHYPHHVPQDLLDLNIDTQLRVNDISDQDISSIISHELRVDGTLDFNFAEMGAQHK